MDKEGDFCFTFGELRELLDIIQKKKWKKVSKDLKEKIDYYLHGDLTKPRRKK